MAQLHEDGPLASAIGGTRLDVLLAIRRQLADTIDAGPSPRDLASLTLRLSDVDSEVRALQTAGDPIAAAASIEPDAWTG